MHYSKISTLIISGAVVLAASVSPVKAQAPSADPTRVAGIVAIVGDSVITSAYLVDASGRRVQELRQQKLPVPATAEDIKAMQEELINERIEELVILQTIARDTTYKLNEDNVLTVVEERYNEMQAQQGGPVVFQQRLRASGLSSQQYRNLLAAQVRTEELFKMFRSRMAQNRQPPKATEKEIQDLFPAWQRSRGPRPALVAFQQIKVRVAPADTSLARARAKADSLYMALLKDREAFGDYARRFSDDAGTKEKGGEFGWFSESEVAKEFGRAAFSAPAGALLPPVRSQFGYHIIEVQRRRGNQAQARHILIAPIATAAEVDRAKARADSAVEKLRAGADIAELAKQYGDPTEDVSLTGIDPDKLREGTGLDLTKAAKGDIVGPSPSPAGPEQYFTIARVTDTSPAGEWTLNDPGVRDNLKNIVETQKLLNEVVSELRRKMYIEIRPR
jgi:peptidyl-prolyl cis-trans isomerase SurA